MNIPLLTKDDIDVRVQSVKENKTGRVGAVLLLYKNARVDMRILDEVYGVGNWQRTHEVINGNLFCNIDIWDADKRCWVRKQDVGVESNTEKEKGQASDAFKRAGFNVGIGRELYTAPFIYVELQGNEYTTKNGKLQCLSAFFVKEIAYNERREISRLVIADKTGKVRFTYNGEAGGRATPTEANKLDPDIPDGATESLRAKLYSVAQSKGYSKKAIDTVAMRDYNRPVNELSADEVKEALKKLESAPDKIHKVGNHERFME